MVLRQPCPSYSLPDQGIFTGSLGESILLLRKEDRQESPAKFIRSHCSMPENLVSSSRKLHGCRVVCSVGKLFFLVSLGAVFLLACGGTSAGNRDILRSDILLLKQEDRRLRDEIAVLDSLVKNRMQQLDRFNANFGADVRQLNERMSIIEQRLNDIEKRLSRVTVGARPADSLTDRPPADAARPSEPRPGEIFDLAYKDYTASNYQIAIEGFLDFLEKFPDSPMVAEVCLYLGDSYRSLKKYGEAISHYKVIVDKYPDSPLHADALYKIGDCLIVAGDRSRGEIFLQALIQKFPDSKAAALARAKLNP